MKWRSGIVIFIFALLSGCGFHLRGPEPLAPPLKNMYLQSADPYSQLARYLKQSLKLSGVVFAPTPASATTILDLREQQTHQLLGVGGTQQTRLYNLNLIVTFAILDSHNVMLVPPISITETRIVTIEANQIMGGSNEETNLFQQMRRAAVFDIMLRLSSPTVSEAVTPTREKKSNETTVSTTGSIPLEKTGPIISR